MVVAVEKQNKSHRDDSRLEYIGAKISKNQKVAYKARLEGTGLTTSEIIQYVVQQISEGNLDAIYPVAQRMKT